MKNPFSLTSLPPAFSGGCKPRVLTTTKRDGVGVAGFIIDYPPTILCPPEALQSSPSTNRYKERHEEKACSAIVGSADGPKKSPKLAEPSHRTISSSPTSRGSGCAHRVTPALVCTTRPAPTQHDQCFVPVHVSLFNRELPLSYVKSDSRVNRLKTPKSDTTSSGSNPFEAVRADLILSTSF